MEVKKDPVSFIAAWGSIESLRGDGGFEGPEKRLEIIVRLTPESPPNGLRAAGKDEWGEVIATLNAKIVSAVSNEHLDSYVLTESSLFVAQNKVIMITCGTTTLLEALPSVLLIVETLKCEVEWASFMRKNFSYPWEQKGPHSSLQSENQALKASFPRGSPFIFGPVDSDHYFFFVYDDVRRPAVENETQLSMTMYQMDPTVASCFFCDSFESTNERTEAIRNSSGLSKLLEGWVVQDLQFAPCGYSINTLRGPEYQTMHITPEEHCSFASYETNSPLENVSERLNMVLSIFKPRRFAVALIVDPQSALASSLAIGGLIGVEQQYFEEYSICNRTINEFAPGYVALELNFMLTADVQQTPSPSGRSPVQQKPPMEE